jgi:hypothetical protein
MSSPLEQLGLIWNTHQEIIAVGRVAGRAGVMCAIAQNMPPHVCPQHGRRMPTPRLSAAGEVIFLPLAAGCGLKMVLFVPAGPLSPRRGFVDVFAGSVSGAEEQTARAISAHAQSACLLSLQMGSIN